MYIIYLFYTFDFYYSIECLSELFSFYRPPKNFVVCFIIDNLRNGLETQAKVYATSVIRFTLEPCNFTLNAFQDSVFTYFKQEQKCECNYRLLKRFREINKAENHHLMFP